MSTFFKVYMASWLLASLLAAALLVARRRHFALCRRPYWRFLLAPWKVATFAVSATGLTVMAPYTGDPTWDYFDAAFMSALAFTTAPWSVGVLYRAMRGKEGVVAIYVAACVWMFSASWSYDGYQVWLNGYYPVTWAANIAASSVLYACAGMFWSLEWRTGRGVTFGFMEEDWPAARAGPEFRKVLWFALPFMLIVAGMILPFFWN